MYTSQIKDLHWYWTNPQKQQVYTYIIINHTVGLSSICFLASQFTKKTHNKTKQNERKQKQTNKQTKTKNKKKVKRAFPISYYKQ